MDHMHDYLKRICAASDFLLWDCQTRCMNLMYHFQTTIMLVVSRSESWPIFIIGKWLLSSKEFLGVFGGIHLGICFTIISYLCIPCVILLDGYLRFNVISCILRNKIFYVAFYTTGHALIYDWLPFVVF